MLEIAENLVERLFVSIERILLKTFL